MYQCLINSARNAVVMGRGEKGREKDEGGIAFERGVGGKYPGLVFVFSCTFQIMCIHLENQNCTFELFFLFCSAVRGAFFWGRMIEIEWEEKEMVIHLLLCCE